MAVYRLNQIARKLNVGSNTIFEFLKEKGYNIDSSPNTKVGQEEYDLLSKRFADAAHDKEEASELIIGTTENTVVNTQGVSKKRKDEERILIKDNATIGQETEKISHRKTLEKPKVLGTIDLEKKSKKPVQKVEEKPVQKVEEKPAQKVEEKPPVEEIPSPPTEPKPVENEVIKAKAGVLRGLKVLDKIVIKKEQKPTPVASSDKNQERKKRPRKRIVSDKPSKSAPRRKTEELSEQEIQNKIKATLSKLSSGSSGTKRSKYKKIRKTANNEAEQELQHEQLAEAKKLSVTEFVSANDLASLMDVSVNEVISACLTLGLFVSINQRIDAETITIIADEFGYEVEFTEIKEEEQLQEDQIDDEKDLEERAPIVTIMGHVDHGKTSLLDYIRKAKVTEQEAGGITQHIGAYDVTTTTGRRIAFLDTPGHEAFTAMRARGARITDVAIIVIAADDGIMPQTKEAINHAQVGNVPIVFAINKSDKPNANPEKIKEGLSHLNILVEDWGGKYQSQEVSAKTGKGVDELLEKVLLEAEMLALKANNQKPAIGTVVEASLDKGRGFLATAMVQAGHLNTGDVILAGPYFGKIKAMFDHRGKKIEAAISSTPVLMLGLNGAPQAGDNFKVMQSEREAREIATKRGQILREQTIRTKKHIKLDEIGRRLAIGNFKELNIIIKGDVDGSIEAIADSLLKLTNEEVQLNILHKAVGQISESDVLLASASDAIIVGFQVRPSSSARKLAEAEEIEIRLYSIIYDAINDVKDAIEGLLEPTKEEHITGTIEVREVFKITRVGTVAGCYVREGVIKRANRIRLIRDGIVVYTGEMGQLRRFKEDVNEIRGSFECGLSIKNFNDIQVGDEIEGFEIKEVKRTLK